MRSSSGRREALLWSRHFRDDSKQLCTGAQKSEGESQNLDRKPRTETYMTGGSLLGGDAGLLLGGNQQTC